MHPHLKPFLTFAHAERARGLLWQEKLINWLSRIYTIRGVKVMLDADLAEIYGYTTKRFNEQVKNNIEKFDEDFRFQLTLKEAETCSRSKISSLNNSRRGTNIKYAPYAFTEQGIYMLMTVLKGERATAQSKALIRLFKQMKDCIVQNQQLIGVDLFCSEYSPADKDEE